MQKSVILIFFGKRHLVCVFTTLCDWPIIFQVKFHKIIVCLPKNRSLIFLCLIHSMSRVIYWKLLTRMQKNPVFFRVFWETPSSVRFHNFFVWDWFCECANSISPDQVLIFKSACKNSIQNITPLSSQFKQRNSLKFLIFACKKSSNLNIFPKTPTSERFYNFLCEIDFVFVQVQFHGVNF